MEKSKNNKASLKLKQLKKKTVQPNKSKWKLKEIETEGRAAQQQRIEFQIALLQGIEVITTKYDKIKK